MKEGDSKNQVEFFEANIAFINEKRRFQNQVKFFEANMAFIDDEPQPTTLTCYLC